MRLARTVLLGIIALGAGLWYLGDSFGVDRADWGRYALAAAAIVGLIVIAAALASLVLRLFRR